MMKSALTILLLILCAALLQGMPTSRRGRCLCRGKRMPGVDIRNIAEVEYHLPSSSCEHEELVVVFKTDGRRGCLDTNRVQGRRIKEAIMKKKK
ncbi:C-X-C motif chemokine 11-like [Sceloporus undulatus]|uniref:C-X-C motif chemokine 11-like n=1 Tax=Sceloporus undulatus TaxID=8520 RepID=UPI001C4ACDAF|nr:C-X-C motif chemokine 11-like [Sceloporus undulatus]